MIWKKCLTENFSYESLIFQVNHVIFQADLPLTEEPEPQNEGQFYPLQFNGLKNSSAFSN